MISEALRNQRDLTRSELISLSFHIPRKPDMFEPDEVQYYQEIQEQHRKMLGVSTFQTTEEKQEAQRAALSIHELPQDSSTDKLVIISLNQIHTDDDPYLQQIAELLHKTEAEEWNQQEAMAVDPANGLFTWSSERYRQLQSSAANPLPLSNQLIKKAAALFGMERNPSGYNRTRINYAGEQHETAMCEHCDSQQGADAGDNETHAVMLFTSSTGEKPGQVRNFMVTAAHDVNISTRLMPAITEPGQHLVLMTRALNARRRHKLETGIGRRRSMQTRLRFVGSFQQFEDVISRAKAICGDRLRLV